jgi:hypothetical protein
MKISEFAANTENAVEGVWEDIDGLRLLIARFNNPEYLKLIRKYAKPLTRSRKQVKMETAEDIAIRAMSEAILLNWENLEDEDGEPIPYSQKKAYELLKEHRDFYEMVLEISRDTERFVEADREEDEGN